MTHNCLSRLIDALSAATVLSAVMVLQGCSTVPDETRQPATPMTLEQKLADFCEAPANPNPISDSSALTRQTGIVTIIKQVQSDSYQRGIDFPALRCVVRDTAQWNLIRPLFINTNWLSERFDFKSVQLVIATYGLTAQAGPEIRIPAITNRENVVEVHVLGVPNSGCTVAGDMRTSPFTAVVTPRTKNPILFKEWIPVVRPCS
jgi:hypothetical protein